MSLSQDKSLLAVARENKSIEIWNPESWAQLLIIPGNKNCDIRNIHWLEPEAIMNQKQGDNVNPLYYKSEKKGYKKRRLITTGLNGQVIEWDLQNLKAKIKYSTHTAIWNSKMLGKFIYLTCEDGTIKILKVKKSKIDIVRTLVKVDAKALSLTFDTSSNNPKELVKVIYAGYSDSSIRKWDLLTGNTTLHFQKQTKKSQIQQGQCYIWCLKSFKKYLISGDSKGDVSIWDSEYGTLIKSFSNLKGDILAIEINLAFSSIYASGVDSRILAIQMKENNEGVQEFVFSSIFRGQSHDIRSLVLLNKNQLLSGGVTTDICVYNLNTGRFKDQFGKNSKQQQLAPKSRHVPPFPFKSPTKISKDLILVINGNNQFIELWSTESHQLLLRIEKKGDQNIQCYDLCNKFIAYSDSRDTQIFEFDQETLSIKKLTAKICHQNGLQNLPVALWLSIYYDPNTLKHQLLLLDLNLNLYQCDLVTLSFSLLTNLQEVLTNHQIKLRSLDKVVNLCHFNPLTNLFVISFINHKMFYVFDLKNQSLYWTLPSIENSIPLCCESDQDKLIVAYDTNKIMVFDLLNKQIHDWSKANMDKFPANFLNRYNRIVGILQISQSKYILFTNYTYITLDLTQSLPQESAIIEDHPGKQIGEQSLLAKSWFDNLKISQTKYIQNIDINNQQEKEQETGEKTNNLTISNKLKGILTMSYDQKTKHLKVVENVWKKLVQNFPGTLALPKYGH